jgi:murein DD-endopeptidase MepM/ murein hydrolase activator NlpD
LYFTVRRRLLRLLWIALAAPLVYWIYLQVDPKPLPGLRVRGEPLPRTESADRVFARIAQRWAEQELSIVTGPHLTRAKRKELGARLEVADVAARVRRLGHTGNPLLDLWVALDAARGRRDVAWHPRIDRIVLGRYVRAVRNIVERPPIAGTTDSAGWSVAGVPGLTLDTVDTVEELDHVLRNDALSLSLPLRVVPPPKALAIGSPDAVIYDEGQEGGGELTGTATWDPARMQAARPRAFLPTQGCEPMDPPYERFCQGPRQVAMPFGAAAELADRLELGQVPTVGRLLHNGPRADWVEAAGGPVPRARTMLWPTPQGRLWRRFGYVRHPPFENLLHRGIDVGALRGAPLLAVGDGIVAYSDNGIRGYGNLLVIVHADASVTFSAHCKAIYVFPGQRVRRGQIVGEVGDTGLARGVHVHWEYHVRGDAVDPEGWFSGGM